MSQLDEMIGVERQAVEGLLQDNLDRALRLNKLGHNLYSRYLQTKDTADLEEAIDIGRRAIETTPENPTDRALCLRNLGVRLSDRYTCTGSVTDLDEAIELGRQAITIIPQEHRFRASCLNSLVSSLTKRYDYTDATADLEEAIGFERQAIKVIPRDDPGRALHLNNLGVKLRNRYARLGSLADLKEAIQVGRQAVETVPQGHTDRAHYLSTLGVSLSDLYECTGDAADLEEAIQVERQAVETSTQDRLDRAELVSNLGASLRIRYTRTGSIADLREAIKFARHAIEAMPQNHPNRALSLNNLGVSLCDQYQCTGDILDLEEAIRVGRQAVETASKDHPDRTRYLSNLGACLTDRYDCTGNAADLEEAIQVGRHVIETTPQDHSTRAFKLNCLGLRLGLRYRSTGSLADVEEAIEISKQAVEATPKGHLDRALYISSLGAHLSDRYARTRSATDLEEAVMLARQAVEIIPQDHQDRFKYLRALGVILRSRYIHIGSIADLEEAIQIGRRTIESTPKGHIDQAMHFSNLGAKLKDRYAHTGNIADLKEAVQLGLQAVEATPQGHPDQARYLCDLGVTQGSWYKYTGEISDLESAIASHQAALMVSNARGAFRIQAGMYILIYCASVSRWNQAYEAIRFTIGLIPKFTPRTLQNSDKQYLLSNISQLACDAAAVALRAGKSPLDALSLLEQARGVLAGFGEEIHLDIVDLQKNAPELAQRFIDLRDDIKKLIVPKPLDHERYAKLLRDPGSDRFHEVEQEFERLIDEIRERTGFEDFLRPLGCEAMQSAATHGHVIVVNASDFGCDAIIIGEREIWSMPLLSCDIDRAREIVEQDNPGSLASLEWLWDTIAKPILDALSFTQPPSEETWPHIWWIPTGILSKFPLHAAGYHARVSFETVLDRVMSSYSASVKALLHSRRRSLILPEAPQALLIGMSTTPGQSSLPFVSREVATLRDLFQAVGYTPVEPERRKQDVLMCMPKCHIFHFAGHGKVDVYDPSQSCLLLEDCTSDPFTVADISQLNLRIHAPFLAYLSACGTGEICNEDFLDESIHLIGAYQQSGFRHVIGTLWRVDDKLCVDMARITYENLSKYGLTDESVCQALHLATRQLRTSWLNELAAKDRDRSIPKVYSQRRDGDDMTRSIRSHYHHHELPLRDIECDDEDERIEAPPWVPYIHFGV